MARDQRGNKKGALSGKRSSGKTAAGKSRIGRRTPYKLTSDQEKQAEVVACPSRGPHDRDCICGGAGTIKAIEG